MCGEDDSVTPSNPFATRFIRPGALAYQFVPGESAGSIVERLQQSGWRGQIIGPHGSGKSTLLAALGPAIAAAGQRVWSTCLRESQRAMRAGWVRESADNSASLIVIDGYEQLSAWQRMRVRAACGRRGWGLLVTAHSDVGLPTVVETKSDLTRALSVVQALLVERKMTIAPEVVAEHFRAAGGNLRETLFRLYDVWQELETRR